MTTIRSPRVERTAPPTAVADRVLGAGSALLVAAHAVLAIVFVPRWPEGVEFVQWSAIAVPLAMIAITVAMWRARAASRVLLSLQLITAAIFAGSGILAATTGTRIVTDEVDLWTALAALTAQYLVALGVLGRGTWRGVQRWLPIAGASWATLVLPLIVVAGETGLEWWVFILYVCAGLIANGVALALRPGPAATASS